MRKDPTTWFGVIGALGALLVSASALLGAPGWLTALGLALMGVGQYGTGRNAANTGDVKPQPQEATERATRPQEATERAAQPQPNAASAGAGDGPR